MDSVETNRNLEILFIGTFHTIEHAIKRELRRRGISPKIAAMLTEIYRHDSPSPLELAKVSNRRPQTITAIIHRMEEKGLIKREINPKKKNTYKISLTEKGLSEYQKILSIDIFAKSIETLSEEKRHQLRECLEEIMKHAKESGYFSYLA